MKVEFEKGRVTKWDEEGERVREKKPKKSRFIMEKIVISSHFQQRKQEIKRKLCFLVSIITWPFRISNVLCRFVLTLEIKWEEKEVRDLRKQA